MGTEIKRNLQGHEDIIANGLGSFIDVGRSLMAIRDEKLYAGKHDTFEQYCKVRWGLSRPRAYQFIEAHEVVENLSTSVDIKTVKAGVKDAILLPSSEAQARAVAAASNDPKTQAKVWKAAIEIAPKDKDGKPKITAPVIKQAGESIVGGKPREPGEDKPEERHQSADTTPFDAPLVGAEWVVKNAVPKSQEFAALIAQALGDRAGEFSVKKVEQAAKVLCEQFEGVRRILLNAQSKFRRRAG